MGEMCLAKLTGSVVGQTVTFSLSFRGHLTDKVKEQLRRVGTDMVVISGGLTGMLQPLDVSMNRPFKVEFRRLYTE